MTTPKAILIGFGLVALAIASLPFSSGFVPKAQAMGCASHIDLVLVTNKLNEEIRTNFKFLKNIETYTYLTAEKVGVDMEWVADYLNPSSR